MTIVLFLLGMVAGTSAFNSLYFSRQIHIPRGYAKRLRSTADGSTTDLVTPDDPRIMPIELSDELKTSFMSYAMSTILSRALPDARDGLKPVHRRVLYAMQVLNLTPDSSYRKCARVVGEVLGKFHPHGDQSVYDALVRMAQDFVMLHPLVAGHGNFGSVDNDPPAAMRYTEAKLSNIAYDTLMNDIKEDTVDFIPNFDGNEIEPVVLPARVPMLLLNGASGIAVGMSTNIPPHNLGELCDAVVAIVNNPGLSDEVCSPAAV
jgi:DNA gyrase subunit A